MMKITYRNPVVTAPIVIYTVRHGQSVGNARGFDDESLENLSNHQFPLTNQGHAEIELSANFIRDNKILKQNTGLYTSNFLRAKDTMEGILAKHDDEFQVTVDSRLDEWWKGIFHSLSKKDICDHYPLEQSIRAREGEHHYRPPQGQAGKDVEINLISFLAEVSEDEILIAGHGRSFAFLRRLITCQPLDLNCKYLSPKNGEIWMFTRKGDHYDFTSLYVPDLINEGIL